jgi:hypothetical protein
MQMDDKAMHEEFASHRAAIADNNAKLQSIPRKFRSLLQAFDKVGGGDATTMDISKNARPEEIAALTAHGWDGKSPLPVDVARQLELIKQRKAELKDKLGVDVSTEEEALARLEARESLSVDNLDITPIEAVEDPEVLSSIEHIQSDQSQQVFADILAPGNKERLASIVAQVEKKVSPVVYDSRQQQSPAPALPPQPTMAAPVATKPPLIQPKINRTVAPPLPTAPVRSAPVQPPVRPAPSPAAAAPLPVQPPPATTAETSSGKTEPTTCPRCHLDLRQKLTIEPTKEDVSTRILSFGSKIQGGDGRFRKTYSIFGTFQLTFRELLASELKYIWQAETSPIYSQVRAGQENAAAMILVDRINLRRHLCGLEKVVNTKDGTTVEMAPLQLWIDQAHTDPNIAAEDAVETALQRMEDYARTSCYGVESVMMASGRAFNHFEEIVAALWNNQDFYEGTR